MDVVVTIVLVAAIVVAIGSLVFIIAMPGVGERFTEFYILGLEGTADCYPAEFVMHGGSVVMVRYSCADGVIWEVKEGVGRVTLGIVNHEQERTNYRVEVWIDDSQVRALVLDEPGHLELDSVSISLDNNEEWKHEIGFVPREPSSEAQKVEFLLYKGDNVEPYLSLHLWVDVESS